MALFPFGTIHAPSVPFALQTSCDGVMPELSGKLFRSLKSENSAPSRPRCRRNYQVDKISLPQQKEQIKNKIKNDDKGRIQSHCSVQVR
jgi:hypothetical protein